VTLELHYKTGFIADQLDALDPEPQGRDVSTDEAKSELLAILQRISHPIDLACASQIGKRLAISQLTPYPSTAISLNEPKPQPNQPLNIRNLLFANSNFPGASNSSFNGTITRSVFWSTNIACQWLNILSRDPYIVPFEHERPERLRLCRGPIKSFPRLDALQFTCLSILLCSSYTASMSPKHTHEYSQTPRVHYHWLFQS